MSADGMAPEADPAVAKKVIEVVATVLDCDAANITIETELHELGAESLDYLDIAFSLERAFNVHFPRVGVLQRAVSHFGEDKLWVNGQVTEFGVELLKRGMPELKIEGELRLNQLRTMFVVGTLVRVVNRLLLAKSQISRECPKCQGALEELPDTPALRCSSCSHTVPFPSGDDIMTADLTEIGERLLAAGGVGKPAAQSASPAG
jgi:acyl carrier protein